MAEFRKMKRNLLLLAACYFCGVTVFFANGAIINVIAKQIAKEGNLEPSLATFPFGFMVSFTALVLAPAGLAMNKFGRKKVFMLAAILGSAGSMVCMGGLLSDSMTALCLFTFGVALQGCAYGVVNYYRHVAVLMGGVDDGVKAWCVAIVISSGTLAGFIGPGITSLSQLVFPAYSYLLIYLVLSAIYVSHIVLLYFVNVQNELGQNQTASDEHEVVKPRSLFKVVTQPQYIHACVNGTVGNSLMVMFTGITPILLSDHISVVYLSIIIQLHAVCMFLPSFLTSKLIGKYGHLYLTCIGYILGAVGSGIYLITDPDVWIVYACRTVAMVLIGISWNFTFIASTTQLASCYKLNEKNKAQAFNDTCLFGFGGLLALLSGTFLKLLGLFYITICCVVIYGSVALINVIYVVKQNNQRKIVLASPEAEKFMPEKDEPKLQAINDKPV